MSQSSRRSSSLLERIARIEDELRALKFEAMQEMAEPEEDPEQTVEFQEEEEEPEAQAEQQSSEQPVYENSLGQAYEVQATPIHCGAGEVLNPSDGRVHCLRRSAV